MKKIAYLILFFTFLNSCSKDDNSSSSSGYSINPPSWIIGTWVQRSNGNIIAGHKFTKNDHITISFGGIETSDKSAMDVYKNAGKNPKTEEVITNSSYELVIDFGTGQTITYNFKKKNDQTILWVQASNAELTKL
jgi:hypothetical protein